MKQVTRNIDPESARDLLERVPRACMAFTTDEGPQVEPIRLLWRDNRYFVGVPEPADRRLAARQEVVVLVDEGLYFFDLRAIYVRGQIQPIDGPNGVPANHRWFEVVPLKVVAWDYGTLREVDDAS